MLYRIAVGLTLALAVTQPLTAQVGGGNGVVDPVS
jgi:hypothetical protein